MKLGGSIRRRRRGGGGTPLWKSLVSRTAKKGTAAVAWLWKFLKDPWALGGLAALAVVGFAGGYLVSTRLVYPPPPPPGDLSPVPNLREQQPVEVADTLRVLGLAMDPVDSLSHPTIPAGRIVGQSPLAGQLLLVGDSVRVTLSTGPEQRPVPDVMGLDADRARTVLEASGFRVSLD
ncbi:MAG: PASTA domain-containing protein, partial [Gemmatimonadetes bacterium]|nr:PASTA domain-containing protein [Gemmatimonadota bacterium]